MQLAGHHHTSLARHRSCPASQFLHTLRATLLCTVANASKNPDEIFNRVLGKKGSVGPGGGNQPMLQLPYDDQPVGGRPGSGAPPRPGSGAPPSARGGGSGPTSPQGNFPGGPTGE